MNDNEQLVLEICGSQNLCITNTFFEGKISRKLSWRHLRSGHWHQLDLVLTRRCNLKEVQHTRSYQSAECDIDHSLVGCRVRICVKKMYRKKTLCHLRINMSEIKDKQKCEQFHNETIKLSLALISVNEAWCTLIIIINAMSEFELSWPTEQSSSSFLCPALFSQSQPMSVRMLP